MTHSAISRRTLVKQGGATLAGLSVLRLAGPASAFQNNSDGEVIPWLDKLEPNPVPEVIVQQLDWEKLDSWITPLDQFFVVKHYNLPTLSERDWNLEISGLVEHPTTLTLKDLKARERSEVTFTMECSGNTGLPFFNGGVGNATWAGTQLAPLLKEAGVLEHGIEVVFWGADAGERTWRDMKITEQFARSMSLSDAMSEDNLLVYEMNDAELPPLHGYPLRLIAPGWYGVANVKWLTRIEVIDRRYQGWIMAQDYVTIREEKHDGKSVWTFTSVANDRLKSAPAKVTKQDGNYSILGVAWGESIGGVEVRIDEEAWQPVMLSKDEGSKFAWTFWTFDWKAPTPGEHTITSRATAVSGEVQPAPDDPLLAGKKTYWESNGQITRRIRMA